jgi:hypothetical protein
MSESEGSKIKNIRANYFSNQKEKYKKEIKDRINSGDLRSHAELGINNAALIYKFDDEDECKILKKVYEELPVHNGVELSYESNFWGDDCKIRANW